MSRALSIMLMVLVAALLLYGTSGFPPWADGRQPASLHVSPRYLERTLEETGVPNAVTSVLADYRGYDTMFETSVIFTAGVAVMMLLRRSRNGNGPRR